MTKNKLILNPDDYSAATYMLEETEEDKTNISIKVVKAVIKLLMTIVIIGALVFVYTHYIQNNFRTISTWLTNQKEFLFPRMRKPVVIREEISVSEKVKKIVPVMDIKKDPAVDTPSSTVKDDDLFDEYMKLIQESLVND